MRPSARGRGPGAGDPGASFEACPRAVQPLGARQRARGRAPGRIALASQALVGQAPTTTVGPDRGDVGGSAGPGPRDLRHGRPGRGPAPTSPERGPLGATLREPHVGWFGRHGRRRVRIARRGQRGFFVLQGCTVFGGGPGSRGFIVVFVPAHWLGVSLNLDPDGTAIGLEGPAPLSGEARTGHPPLTRASWPLPAAGGSMWRGRPAHPQCSQRCPWLAVGLAARDPRCSSTSWGRGDAAAAGAARTATSTDIFRPVARTCSASPALDGYYKRVNPAFERTLGHTASRACCRARLLEFVHPDDRERNRQDARRTRPRGGDVLGYEEPGPSRADGAGDLAAVGNTAGDAGEWGAGVRPPPATVTEKPDADRGAGPRCVGVATLVAEGPRRPGALFQRGCGRGRSGARRGRDAPAALRGGRQEPRWVGSSGASDADLGVDSHPSAVPIVVSRPPLGCDRRRLGGIPEMAGGDTETRMAQFHRSWWRPPSLTPRGSGRGRCVAPSQSRRRADEGPPEGSRREPARWRAAAAHEHDAWALAGWPANELARPTRRSPSCWRRPLSNAEQGDRRGGAKARAPASSPRVLHRGRARARAQDARAPAPPIPVTVDRADRRTVARARSRVQRLLHREQRR